MRFCRRDGNEALAAFNRAAWGKRRDLRPGSAKAIGAIGRHAGSLFDAAVLLLLLLLMVREAVKGSRAGGQDESPSGCRGGIAENDAMARMGRDAENSVALALTNTLRGFCFPLPRLTRSEKAQPHNYARNAKVESLQNCWDKLFVAKPRGCPLHARRRSDDSPGRCQLLAVRQGDARPTRWA